MGGFSLLSGLAGNVPQGTQPGMDALMQAIMGNQMAAAQGAPIQQQAAAQGAPQTPQHQTLRQLIAGYLNAPSQTNQPRTRMQDVISILFGNQPRLPLINAARGVTPAPAPQSALGAAYGYGYTPPFIPPSSK